MVPVRDEKLKVAFMAWFTHWMESNVSWRAPELATKTWMEFTNMLRTMFEKTPYGRDVSMALRACLAAGCAAKTRENTALDEDTTCC